MANVHTTNITEVERLVTRLNIDGFRAVCTMANDDSISSRCTIDGYEWEICVYPARTASTPDSKPWVALQLILLSKARTPVVRATLSCLTLDPEMQPSAEKSKSGVFSRPKDSTSLIYLVSADGFHREYAGRKVDFLMVQCTITVLKESPLQISMAKELPVPHSNLDQNLGELLQSEMGADVTFLVSGQSFAAHKLLLAARSPVFKAEFFGEMKEKLSHCVEVEGIEAAVFKAMLHYIYTDMLPELDQGQETAAALTQHLLAAADRYGLDRLKMICENKLSSSLAVDMAATTLALADRHNCLRLKASCVEFIVSTPEILDVVLATEGYKDLVTSCPVMLAELLKAARGRKN